jgi:CHAT domain-containing protein
MNAIALTLSLFIASPICYHSGIFYPGGSDAVCMDEGTMKGGKGVVLSLGLTGLAVGMGSQVTKIETRSVEPRLTGGAVYASCKANDDATDLISDTVCEGWSRPARKEPRAKPQGKALRGARPAPEEEFQESALRDLLANGQIDKLNRAVLWYERKTSTDPKDAQRWSNLSAIYLTRAQKTDGPRDLLRAYGAASRALEIDERLLEARFNKALALERLFLPDAARTAWQDYKARDTTYGWTKEVERRLKALDQSEAVGAWSEQEGLLREAALRGDTDQVKAIVGKYRQAAREYAEQRLFGVWGEAVLARQERVAGGHLSVLRAVGDALAETSGERLVKDSVAAIDEASSTGNVQRLDEIAQGARDFRAGYKDYKDRLAERAESKLTSARDALLGARCALAWRAAFYLVSNDYVSRKYPATVAGAGRLARQIEDAKLPYGALLAHVYWIKGMAESTLGKTRESIADLKMSFDGFKSLGESENAANIDCRLGEVLMSRGRRSEAWRFIYRALRSTPTLRDPDQVAAVYMIAGNAALQDGFDDAALIFQEERVRQSRLSTDNFLAQVEALTWLARFQHHQGDDAGAQASLQEAERFIDNENVEEKQRPRRRADLDMIKGMITEEKDPAGAADLLTSALPVYQKEKNAVFSLWTLLARGRAYRQAKDNDSAKSDFEAALKLYDQMGESLGAEDLRLALLEETDSVFDEMVDLQADQGDPEGAFAYADRARTRVLPGSASKLWTGLPDETKSLLASELQPLSLNEVRRRLPEGVTLVQFSVLRDRVLIWSLRRSGKGEGFFQQLIPRDVLEDRVAQLRAFDSKEGDQAAGDLFDLLIRPWLPSVPAGDRIILIPDKVLHRVPFIVLKDGKTRLIETRSVIIAPSATLHVNALERQDSKPLDLSRGLVVGEPEINHDVPGNETLVSLPEAKKEAEHLAQNRGAKLLVGPAATEAAFLAEAPRAEWIQFSGHAVIDPANTLLSKLVLASGKNGDNGWLTAQEIYSLKLSGTRLVLLAACDTGNEYVPGGEGVTSLARAFLAAGVPTVVASLWSVDDEATAHLFDAFHRHYQASGDPVEALRKAQLDMLHSPNKNYRSPSAWAAFEVIGASADDQP